MRRAIAIGCLGACAGVLVVALTAGGSSTTSRPAAHVVRVAAPRVPAPGKVPPGGVFFPPKGPLGTALGRLRGLYGRALTPPRSRVLPRPRVLPAPSVRGYACPAAGVCGGKPCARFIGSAASSVAAVPVASAGGLPPVLPLPRVTLAGPNTRSCAPAPAVTIPAAVRAGG